MHGLGWVRACHDTGMGGLLTSLAEMAVQSGPKLGITVELDELASRLPPAKLLFSETGCFIVEVPAGLERDILALCARNRVKLFRLGALAGRPRLNIDKGGERIASWNIDDLEELYLNGCRKIFGKE